MFALVEQVHEFGLAENDDGEQFLEAVLQLIKLLEVFEGDGSEVLRLFDDKDVLVVLVGALDQEAFQLADLLLGLDLGCLAGNVHDDGVAQASGADAALGLSFHVDLVVAGVNDRHVLVAEQVLDDFLPDGALTSLDFADDGHEAAVPGGVHHGGLDIAVLVGHVDVLFTGDVVQERVAEQTVLSHGLGMEHLKHFVVSLYGCWIAQ